MSLDKFTFKFTKERLKAIKPPAKPEGKKGGVYDSYKDQSEKGLRLIVSNGGAKTFYLYKKVNGRPQRMKIGSFPEVSIENARKKAVVLKGQIADNKDPSQEIRRLKNTIIFAELFDKYIEKHSKVHKKTWKEDVSTSKRYFGRLLNRKISDITFDDIKELHSSIANNILKDENPKIYAANRALALLKTVFNFAIDSGCEIGNPCLKVKPFKEKSRDRFLHPEELERFFKALEAESNTIARDYIYISLLTGARRSNALAMKWEDINVDRLEWKIPETKNGESLTLPLASEVVNILKLRKIENKEKGYNDEYVFPSNGKLGHLADPKKPWQRILKAANIKDLRLHDLRRTLGSFQASLGANSFIIGKSLGHKSQQATAIYSRLNLDPVRNSVEMATNEMMRYRDG